MMKTSNENKKKETAFEVIKETNEIYSCGKKKTGPRPIGKFPAPIHAARSSCPKKVPSGRKKKTFNKIPPLSPWQVEDSVSRPVAHNTNGYI